jgi:hypothetical protein
VSDETWVLVPCERKRLEVLNELLEMLGRPAQRCVVVSAGAEPIMNGETPATVLHYPHDEINISRWWNLGLSFIRNHYTMDAPHEVLFCESDTVADEYAVPALVDALRVHELSMVGPDWFTGLGAGDVAVYGPNSPRSIEHRVPGTAFMIASEQGLRYDERFRWWYADDDFEMQARNRSGAAVVGGVLLDHGPSADLTPEKQRWADEDRALFVEKWGRQPW